MERVQTLILGAGVVGLACARALARRREVVLCDLSNAFGTGISSRNSEVIHAGLYYPTGSRKAVGDERFGLHNWTCDMLILLKGLMGQQAFEQMSKTSEEGICGKLIVATGEAQLSQLHALEMKAAGNGVKLERLSPQEVKQMEPEVFCVEALHSPRTGILVILVESPSEMKRDGTGRDGCDFPGGIVDSHSFMQALLADAEEHGASLALRTRIRGGQVYDTGVVLELESIDSGDVFTIEAEEVVNCCGLSAPRVARNLGMEAVPKEYFCRGSYYALQGGLQPFSRLVYPVPEPQTSGLGVHATVDLQGQVRFGPDVEWLPQEILPGLDVDEAAYGPQQAAAYEVDNKKSEAFYSEVRRYWPGLPDGALIADYSGVHQKYTRKVQRHFAWSLATPFACRSWSTGGQSGGSPMERSTFSNSEVEVGMTVPDLSDELRAPFMAGGSLHHLLHQAEEKTPLTLAAQSKIAIQEIEQNLLRARHRFRDLQQQVLDPGLAVLTGGPLSKGNC
eukprot:symbB.v1.2.004675.t2/scaffold230.1/size260421/12